MSLRVVEEALRGDPPRLWLVHGDARLLVERAVERLVAWGQVRCGPPAFNLGVWHGSDASAVEAIRAARTLPMMAELRVVVLKELEAATDPVLAALLEYAADPVDTTLLVACGSGFPKTRKGGTNWSAKLQAAVKRRGRVVKLGTGDVPPALFAREHAASLGKELGGREASLLVELVGGDLGRLAQEIEKVALYAGDERRLDADAIHGACSLLAEAVVWDLTTGIAVRDPARAMGALHRLLEEGGENNPHRLLALVAWQLRQVLQVAEQVAHGASDAQARQATGMRGDQVTRIRAALRGGLPDPAEVLERLARANHAMHSHRAGERRVLEGLVLDLCGG